MALFLRKNMDPEDLEYMSEVDAALRRRGHPWAFALSFVIVCIFVIFLIWAYFSSLDEATRGVGQVIPSQGTQLIQNQDGGTILEMFVHENQVVEQGELLARIDTVGIASSLRDLTNKKIENEVALARLQAEADGTELTFSQELIDQHPEAVANQLQVYRTRREQFEGEDRALQALLEQRDRERQELLASRKKTEDSLLITRQQEANVRSLAERGVYSQMDYLNLKQRIVALEGELAALVQNISRAQSAVAEAQERLKNRHSERQAQIADEVSRRRVELNSLNEQLAAGGSRATRADLRAPMKGIVTRILIKQGGVARPGETIMELLPIEDTLEVEARIRPADIGFLKPGQKAMIKISAYDYEIYGGLEADLIQISAGTVEDKRGEAAYLVRLRTRKNALVYNGQPLPIMPGMTVTVDILTGEKSVLDYLLKPILKSEQDTGKGS